MPILILFGIFAGYGAISFVQSCKTNARPRNKSQSEHMTDQMIGKSKKRMPENPPTLQIGA